MKASRQQIKQVGTREREMVEMKARHEEETAALQLELSEVRGLLEDTTQQLKREGEVRMRDLAKVKRGMWGKREGREGGRGRERVRGKE